MNSSKTVLDIANVPFRLMPWLRIVNTQLTYNDATRMFHQGLISQRQYDWYRLFWTWSATRFSDVENANIKQYRFAQKLGYQALERRFTRIKLLRHKLYNTVFAPYLHPQVSALKEAA